MFFKIFKYYYIFFGVYITIKKSFVKSLDNIEYDNQSSSELTTRFYNTESALKIAGKNHANKQNSTIKDLNGINRTLSTNDNLSSNKNFEVDYRSMFLDDDNNTLATYSNNDNNLSVQGMEKAFPWATITLGPEKSLKGIVNYQNKSEVTEREKMHSMSKNNKKIKLVVNLTSTHQSIDTTWKKRLDNPPTVLNVLVAPSAHRQRKDVTNSIINSSVSNNHFQAGEIAVRIMDDDDSDCFYGMTVCKKWTTLPDNIRRKLIHQINHIIEKAMPGKIVYDRVDDDCTGNDRGGNDDDSNNDCKKSKQRVKRGKYCCKERKRAKCKSSVDVENTFDGRRFANINLDLNPNIFKLNSVFTTTEISSTVATTTAPLISTTIDMITQSITTSTKKRIYSKRRKCSRKQNF